MTQTRVGRVVKQNIISFHFTTGGGPAGLAQWLARSLSKRKVRGSIPAAGTLLVIVKKT